ALSGIEWSTLFFFMALFVMVGALEEQGVIENIAELVADASGDSAVREGMIVLWASAAGSAAVDNIPFTAAMIPVVKDLQLSDQQFDDGTWWALALGASFGGNATIIAAAANVAATGVLARAGHPVSFGRFLLIGIPATLISLLIASVYLLIFQLT
ncbi:MAG: SLC13 family permease, partial [Gaiellales bacterium]